MLNGAGFIAKFYVSGVKLEADRQTSALSNIDIRVCQKTTLHVNVESPFLPFTSGFQEHSMES